MGDSAAPSESVCGDECTYFTYFGGGCGARDGSARSVHGCVPAVLGIIANGMGRVGRCHTPTLLAVLDAVERLAYSHPRHFDVQVWGLGFRAYIKMECRV